MVLLAALSVGLAMTPIEPRPGPDGCTELQTAARYGDLRALRRLASRTLLGFSAPRANLDDVSDAEGPCAHRTALMVAAEHGQDAVVELLLSSNADARPAAVLEGFGDHPFTARCLAIAAGKPSLAVLLRDASGALRADDLCLDDAKLFAAIAMPDLAQVELLLNGQPHPEVQLAALERLTGRYKGGTRVSLLGPLLHHAQLTGVPLARIFTAAIEADDVQMIERLCAEVKLTGSTELALAVERGRFAMIAPLMRAGARADLGPMTEAVHKALRTRDIATLTELIDAGWRADDETPVLLWALQEDPGMFGRLLEAGFSVEADDAAGTTPLMYAVEHDDLGAMARLLERGASPLTANVVCQTARSIREEGGKERLKALVVPGSPVPGRAARRMHVGCGSARFKVEFDSDVEVYFDGAFVTLESNVVYQTEPGLHTLRIARSTERAVKRQTLQLVPGLNSFDASPDEDE